MDRYYYSERPELGFNIPFVIYFPKEKTSNIVGANFMTPSSTDKKNLSEIFSDLKEKTSPGRLFFENNIITIVPLIPRFPKYDMTYFTSAVYNNKTTFFRFLVVFFLLSLKEKTNFSIFFILPKNLY